jgi:Amidohydrolase family
MVRVFFSLFLISSFSVSAADTTRYVVLMTGKQAGKHLKWSNSPHSISYFFEFNDRGRGPKIQVDIKTDGDGLIVERDARGHDYYKATVSELFLMAAGSAQWKNHIEEEQRKVEGKLFYSPLNSVPAEIELSLKVLQKLPGHEADVLPSGKLKATHLKNHSSKIDGLPIELELYSFVGSGGPPTYLWFTPRKDFFASISGWMSTIAEGHEDLIPELKELQDQIEEDYFYQQASRFTQKQNGAVVLQNVNVFDAVKGKSLAGQSVVFEKGLITQVGKSKKIKVAAGAKVIDGKGKMVLPGLWDNHAHYDMTQGLYHLAAGVTNIKDMANSLDLPETRKKVDQNILLGPEISIMSGFIDFAGPYAGPTGKIVKTLEEGLAGVDYYADKGYDQVKLYSSIPPDWVKPLAERAHQRGLKVCGHIPSFMTAERAVKDGYDQIIHLNMIMLNFLGDTLDTRSMLRFIRVAERSKNIDVNSDAVKQFIALLKERNIVVDPTAAIFESMFTNEPGKLAKGYDGIINMFPAEFRRSFYYGGLPTMKGHEADYKQSFDNMIKMLQLLHKSGITFVPGTDDFPGFTLHRELELYVQAGLTPAETLKLATYISAQVAGKEKEAGTITVGKKANLILVDGDPTKRISDIRRVEMTIKNGNIYDPKALYQSYGFGFWK